MIMGAKTSHRHPELVSGSILPFSPLARGARWMLKRVQQDGDDVTSTLKPRKPKAHRKVEPVRVSLFDQVDLPLPAPVLKLLFARDRRHHFTMTFEPDQHLDAVTIGEAGQRAIAVLPESADKIRRDADVERPARLACQDIDARFPFTDHTPELAAGWTLKQVQGDDCALPS